MAVVRSYSELIASIAKSGHTLPNVVTLNISLYCLKIIVYRLCSYDLTAVYKCIIIIMQLLYFSASL